LQPLLPAAPGKRHRDRNYTVAEKHNDRLLGKEAKNQCPFRDIGTLDRRPDVSRRSFRL
jgi:hypothetical protein